MPQLTFTDCTLRGFGRTTKGAHADFTAKLTIAVSKALEWDGDLPTCFRTAKPDGELTASSVALTPDQKDMVKHAVSLGVARVNGFEIVRRELENQRGKGFRLELRFSVEFQEDGGCAALERYMLTLGESKGRLAVGYTRTAKQGSLLKEEEAEAAGE